MPHKDKKIVEVQLDFTLPPPIYGFHLTVDPSKAQRTIKLVNALERHKDGIEVILPEHRFVVAWSSVKFYVEE